jgi:hypothetical protein
MAKMKDTRRKARIGAPSVDEALIAFTRILVIAG